MSPATGLRVAFRGRVGALELDVAFDAPHRGVTTLFGPSGCGKTTVLRCVAGLQRMADGLCAVGGDVWQDGSVARPPHLRPIGFVFQNPSLFPHLSVRRNLRYGAGPTPSAAAWTEVVDLLGLSHLLDRAPHHLSGGEQQRVAIGRALLSRPRLLLMDEPLSALDRVAKGEILGYLERLCATVTVPLLYVTHDMAEVERLTDMLVLMRAGRVIAAGPLPALQGDPALPLAAAREAAVSLSGVVQGYDTAYGLATLAVDGGLLSVPTTVLAAGTHWRVRIAAGDVSIARDRPGPSTILNVLPARLQSRFAPTPQEITAVLGLGDRGEGCRVLSRITRRSWDTLGLQPGDPVFVQVKAVALEGLASGNAGRRASPSAASFMQ